MGDYDASPRNATDYGAALTVKLEKAVMQRVEYLHAGTYVCTVNLRFLKI